MSGSNQSKAQHLAFAVAAGIAVGYVGGPYATKWLKKLAARNRKQPLKLGYWKIRGLAHQIRLLMGYLKLPYVDEYYEQGGAPDFSRQEWTSVTDTKGIPFSNLPYLIDGDLKLVQSKAIMRHIGRAFDMLGRSDEEQTNVDLLLEELTDFREDMTGMCYSPNFNKIKPKFESETLPKRLRALEAWLQGTGNGGRPRTWAAAGHLTIADFALYDVIDNARAIVPQCLEVTPCPLIRKFMLSFEALPEIQAHMKNPDKFFLRPLNNKSAAFK